MYFFTPDVIAQANEQIVSLDAKVGGLFCILHCLNKEIDENVSYTINGSRLRKQLSVVFDKDPKESFDNVKSSYIIFAKDWNTSFFKRYIKNKIDLLACAVFFLRRNGFEREATEKEVIDTFIERFNLQQYREEWFFEGKKVALAYNSDDVESNQFGFYSKMNYTNTFKSILFNGVIQKSAADLKAAGQVQTLYSGSGVQTCFLLSDEPLDQYYVMSNSDTVEDDEAVEISPEWFEEKAVAFPTLDLEAKDFLLKFNERFAPDKLKDLNGIELLNTVFLNNDNKTNLCYVLEFDKDCRHIFGSIKSGTAYKYGLHYSQKNGSWATGTGRNPQMLTEEEAIELGTQIRDNLLAGASLIEETGELDTLEDYQELYNELVDITDGYINRVWFMKYYALLYPDLFPPIYSSSAQSIVLNKLKITPGENLVYRLGQIREYIKMCHISNVLFSRIFWTYCNNDDDSETAEKEDEIDGGSQLKTCLEITREPRAIKIHPLNLIIYGAPGTGKTYSMIDYALAIIDNIGIKPFKANFPDRKTNVARYKELVKAGRIVFTTFHQNYGYEEFIQGLRPDKNSSSLAFKNEDGVFKKIADKALNDTDGNNYVIIIDEINRANISKVFGELITLIEEDKRWGEIDEMSVTLQSGDPFAVPNNLYIIGTMNSADKSISLIDAALRRRFDFDEQKPDPTLIKDDVLRGVFTRLNKKLVADLQSTDLLIGHSYFMNKTADDLEYILNRNVIPLLYEYYYDVRTKVAKTVEEAIKGTDVSIIENEDDFGRLSVERS